MGDSIEIWSEGNTVDPFMEPDEFGAALESIMGDPSPADADNGKVNDNIAGN